MTKRALLLFLAVGVVWGIPYFFIAIATTEFSTPSIVWLRVTFGAIALLPIVLRRGKLKLALKNWRWVLLFAAVEMVGPWWLITEAERSVPSSLAGLFMSTIPIVAALITGVFFGDRSAFHPLTIAGLVIGFTGVFSLVGIDVANGHLELSAIVMLLISALCYATAPIVVNRTIPQIPGLEVSAVSLAMVSIIYLPFAIFTLPADLEAGTTLSGWSAVLVLGLFASALAFFLFFKLIDEVGPRRATIITYINLVVATILGVALLNEPITSGMLVGFPLIVVGSYLAGRERLPYVRKKNR